jgi:hypothetical protein
MISMRASRWTNAVAELGTREIAPPHEFISIPTGGLDAALPGQRSSCAIAVLIAAGGSDSAKKADLTS